MASYKLLFYNFYLNLVGQDDPVRLPGALYGAKCGISNPENKPSSLHFLLTTLYNQNLVHAWVQHGHDGLPAQAGFPPHLCLEVYNSWFQAQITRIRQEMTKLINGSVRCFVD